jgi:hypothetical protein
MDSFKINLKINLIQLVLFISAFILFTPIGTVSHEYGHIAVAKLLGYETVLHYGSMEWGGTEDYDEVISIYSEFKDEIANNKPFPKQEQLAQLTASIAPDDLLITIGGPLQTVLTGLIGLFILIARRNSIKTTKLKTIDWLAVFMSLFWLREVFNLSMSLGSRILFGRVQYFSGDEAEISKMLHLPVGTVPIILGIMGLMISVFVIFRILPIDSRITFVTGGLLGGTIGFVIWMNIVGPILLP